MAELSEATTVGGATGDLREITTPTGTLRYYEVGDGPPLLFLHGSGPGVTGWRNFRGILPVFAANSAAWSWSSPVSGSATTSAGIRCSRHRGWWRRSWMGWVWTGSISSVTPWAAASASTSLSTIPTGSGKLVTIGGIGTNIFIPGPSEGIRLLQEFTEDPTRQRLVDWLHSMVYDPSMVTDELIEERWTLATDPETLAAARRMYGKAAFAAMMAMMRTADVPMPWARCTRSQRPTLLTWGRDDRVSPLDMALIPMRTIPNAELHVFPNCGHWAMIEAKAAFERTVLAFLSRPRCECETRDTPE